MPVRMVDNPVGMGGSIRSALRFVCTAVNENPPGMAGFFFYMVVSGRACHLLFLPHNEVLEAVHQCLAGGVEDVVGHAHRAPGVPADPGLDDDADAGLGRRLGVHDVDAVVNKAEGGNKRKDRGQRFPERQIHRRHRAVAGFRDGVHLEVADAYLDGRL